ncbi:MULTISPECIES: tol-pal system YbgF family protein [Flavobacteriaceae]|uniref:tetratricopeptide repeat protein n=1 Tax=Flavobacteriaceae TaxID=49546 RepID=UPI0010AE9E89|nr:MULTISPECIES: tetratricopeptide repeat protein [Flavobacteriaceae]NJB37641.1 tetratricopeptide repeat protein [Croceivirga sp. JEA036]TKD62469.1 tetratricopeptide repeat protein [Flavobacterium sp. ASW18X]
MATYKKRGYKPKTKEEEVIIEEQESTTAEVFNTLDEGASKTEAWVSKNQNYIVGAIVAVAVVVLGYLAYTKFVVEPKDTNAANEFSYPMQNFNAALTNEAQKDSLMTLALEGTEGKFGFIDIIEEYSGTPTANMAKYAAGMAYLNLQKYDEAISYLEDFSSDDEVYSALALGGIGDAFSQLEQQKDAFDYYKKAISAAGENDFTAPKFLYKAGVAALQLGNKEQALDYFNRIKEEFPAAKEANSIDALIGFAE